MTEFNFMPEKQPQEQQNTEPQNVEAPQYQPGTVQPFVDIPFDPLRKIDKLYLTKINDKTPTDKEYVDAAVVPVFKTGSTTRAVGEGDGDQEIAHGLGKTPTVIRFTIKWSEAGGFSNGVYTASVSSAFGYYNGYYSTTNSFPIFIKNTPGGGGEEDTGTVSVDGTNITITWDINFGIGTFYILWEAQ